MTKEEYKDRLVEKYSPNFMSSNSKNHNDFICKLARDLMDGIRKLNDQNKDLLNILEDTLKDYIETHNNEYETYEVIWTYPYYSLFNLENTSIEIGEIIGDEIDPFFIQNPYCYCGKLVDNGVKISEFYIR